MIKFLFKPQAPFETIQKNALNPTICIMRSIILQAILDYTATIKPNLKLFYWFFIPNNHFKYICSNAKIQPYIIRREIIKIIKNIHIKKHQNIKSNIKIKQFTPITL
ncbi:MAG: hypothetical protein AAFO15_02575 [Pseudomonadota bacterium]